MKIIIVDNGKGASDIKSFIPSSEIIKPKELKNKKADAYILSDGKPTKDKQEPIFDFLMSTDRPILGIGLGYLYIGSAIGADVVKVKPVKRNIEIKLEHGCPIMIDLKKVNGEQEFGFELRNIPDELQKPAGGKFINDIIQDVERPLIGINMRIETSPDAAKIFKNFMDFVEIYNNYHK